LHVIFIAPLIADGAIGYRPMDRAANCIERKAVFTRENVR
jgi:hypothetical protein